VATEGDAFARLIATEGLGISVPERNVDALAQALSRVLYDEKFFNSCRANVAMVRGRFIWHRTLEPLRDFCRHAGRAADADSVASHLVSPAARVHRGVISRNVNYAIVRYREGGMSFVAQRGMGKLKRLMHERRGSRSGAG
jgi:hypothetical protein